MATIQSQTIKTTGLKPVYVAASASGDLFTLDNRGRTFLHVKNGAGSGSVTVTVNPQRTTAGSPSIGSVTVPAIAVTVPFGEDALIGGFAPAYINADGKISVTYSAVTSLTVAALTVSDYAVGQ